MCVTDSMNNNAAHVCLEICRFCVWHLHCHKVSFLFSNRAETVIFLANTKEQRLVRGLFLLCLWIPVRIWERHSLASSDPASSVPTWAALYHGSDKATAPPPPPPPCPPCRHQASQNTEGLLLLCGTRWRMQIREAVVTGAVSKQNKITGQIALCE